MPASNSISLLPPAGRLNRSAIMSEAHATVFWRRLAKERNGVRSISSYADDLSVAMKSAWNAAYEAAALAGDIDPAFVEKRRQRQEAADRKRKASSPLAVALRRIAEAHA